MTLLSISRPSAMRQSNPRDDYNRFMRSYTNAANDYVRLNMNHPAVNIIEEQKNFILQLAAPGFSKDEIEVNVDKDVLTISAKLNDIKDDESRYLTKEFSKQEFKRNFTLGKSIDSSKIEANYKDGVLTLRIAKREEAIEKPSRKISVG